MKLEISYRKKNDKGTNMWKLNNMLLKKQWVNEEIKEEIRKYLEGNENVNTTFQNLRGALKEVWREKIKAIQVYWKKRKKERKKNLKSTN